MYKSNGLIPKFNGEGNTSICENKPTEYCMQSIKYPIQAGLLSITSVSAVLATLQIFWQITHMVQVVRSAGHPLFWTMR
jgi:hypothetical protein